MFDFFVLLLMYFTCLSIKHYLSHNYAISFGMLIDLVYLTYYKICDR